MAIETKDLWKAAYLMANAGLFKEIRITTGKGGRREPVFVVEGEGMEYLANRYGEGQVMGHLGRQRRSMEYLAMRARQRIREAANDTEAPNGD